MDTLKIGELIPVIYETKGLLSSNLHKKPILVMNEQEVTSGYATISEIVRETTKLIKIKLKSTTYDIYTNITEKELSRICRLNGYILVYKEVIASSAITETVYKNMFLNVTNGAMLFSQHNRSKEDRVIFRLHMPRNLESKEQINYLSEIKNYEVQLYLDNNSQLKDKQGFLHTANEYMFNNANQLWNINTEFSQADKTHLDIINALNFFKNRESNINKIFRKKTVLEY